MEKLTILYLGYTFISFYFLFLYLLTYLQNKKNIYEYENPLRDYSLSIVVPCYNEGKEIGKNIESLIDSDYPGLKKIIVVDDCSKDNSYEIIKSYAEKYPGIVLAVQTPSNTGKAAGSKNYGAQFVDTELIGFSDADSFVKKDSIYKMVGFFNDEKVGGVTSRVLVSNRINMLTRIQAIEYKVIAFTRKILGFLDSIYVTNGPLSIYRRKAFDNVGGFDENNWTEDIEITWHMVSKGWKIKMALPSKAYTKVPEKISIWYKQRLRWNIGGMQTISKYKSNIIKCGMLGLFILPFFVFSWIIGLTGFFFLIYRIYGYLSVKILATKYSLESNVPLLITQDISVNPTILFYFGMVLFFLGLTYLAIAIMHSKEKEFQRHKISDIFIYSFFYLIMYPPLLINSLFKFMMGKKTW